MNSLDNFLEQAWNDHASQTTAVAVRLPEGLQLVQDDSGVARLAALAHHVLGEHLGQWQQGLAFFAQLSERNVAGPNGTGAIARAKASLALSGELADERPTMTASDQCRVTTMAASSLAHLDTARASAFLLEATSRASDLPDSDPAVRALAINANNIAVTLRDSAPLEPLAPKPRELMIAAADVARAQWARAGTWLEVERAEYRLAVCWLAAGEPAQALRHAQRCEAIVRQNGAVPLELFFAAEALCLPAHAAGDSETATAALATAQQAFDALSPEDRTWCRDTLDRLNAAIQGAHGTDATTYRS